MMKCREIKGYQIECCMRGDDYREGMFMRNVFKPNVFRIWHENYEPICSSNAADMLLWLLINSKECVDYHIYIGQVGCSYDTCTENYEYSEGDYHLHYTRQNGVHKWTVEEYED